MLYPKIQVRTISLNACKIHPYSRATGSKLVNQAEVNLRKRVSCQFYWEGKF
jgi:hypothetical protein